MRLKITSFLLFIVILISMLTVFSSASASKEFPNTYEAKNICLYNIDADTIVYSKNMQDKIFPASAVKMMTGIIACEILRNRLDEQVIITDKMLSGAQGFNVKLSSGMSVTAENLLYGLLCGGGNDAALAISNLCGGDFDGFVAMMNERAAEMGMKNTHFTNPTGLDDAKMYSTLSDIMILAKYASKNDLYVEISSTSSYSYKPLNSYEEIKFFNRNALISTFYAYGYKNDNVYGLISGNTELGGYCTVAYAEKNNEHYICAVMGAEADSENIYSYKLVNSLLSYAFNNLTYQRIATQGQHICYADTRFVATQSNVENRGVSCVIKNDIFALTYSDINIEKDLTYRYYLHNDILNAPIGAGMIVGGVDILYNGEIIGTAVLVTSNEVQAEGILLFLDRLKNFFSDRLFWLCIVFAVIIFFSYYYFSEFRFHRKNVKKINYKNFY